MKNIYEFLLIALLFAFGVLVTGAANAAPPWKRQAVTTNGCPDGTSTAVLSPDGSALTVLFDQFTVEAGGSTGKTSDGKYCDMSIPIDIPQGFRMGVYKIDYRGYVNIPQQTHFFITAEYAFAGGRTPSFHRQLVGANEQEYLLTDTIGAGQMKWTGCGGSVVMNIHAELQLDMKHGGGQAMGTLDSMDGVPKKGGVIYRLQLQKCN